MATQVILASAVSGLSGNTAVIDDTVLDSNFVQAFLNLELFKSVSLDFAGCFAVGFALATILILLTYGVFKAFSLLSL